MEDPWKDLPDFNRNLLVDYAGWKTFFDAKQILELNPVKKYEWNKPYLSGEISLNEKNFYIKLNFKNQKIPENSCNCDQGVKGFFCHHAVVLCLYLKIQIEEKNTVLEQKKLISKDETETKLQSLVISNKKGLCLKFRLLLPPNIAYTAPNDSIMVKIDAIINNKPIAPEKLDRGRAYKFESQAYFKIAKYLEGWCNGKLFGLIQLTRDRLKILLDALKNEEAVFKHNEINQSLKWENGIIPEIYQIIKNDKNLSTSQEEEKFQQLTPKRFDYGTIMEVDGSMQYLAIKLPSKESILYDSAHELVKKNQFQFDTLNKTWWLKDRRKTLNFLACHWNDLKKRYRAEFSKNFLRRTKKIRFIKIICKISDQDNKFKLNLKLDAKGIEINDLHNALNQGEQFIETARGIILIESKKIDSFQMIQRALSQEVDRPFSPQFITQIKAENLVETHDLLEGLISKIELPNNWLIISEGLKDFSKLKPAPISNLLNNKLREYQKIGVAWLWHLYQKKLGGILADEMGLGKTVQALAFLECVSLYNKGNEKKPSLVVCPASLLENWKRESNFFTPDLNVYIHHGLKRIKDLNYIKIKNLIITSYSTLTRDQDLFQKINFEVVIADEAQNIKNNQTQNAKALININSIGKFVLTGTPLENSMDDLRSLFDFILPNFLAKTPKNCKRDDRSWYDERAKKQVIRYILRRSKNLVAPELPEKIEQILYCEMDSKQRNFYKKVQEQARNKIQLLENSGANKNQIRFTVLAQLTKLRQICTDPRILDESMDSKDSTKLKAFKQILQESINSGNKILVFSQFVSVLKILKKELDLMSINYCYLDGKTKDRQNICDIFNKNNNIPVFLISLKAGGVGLNITAANIVIHYDPWWNPAVESQATDRAHRIGQKRVVTNIKLLIADSIEEKVVDMQKDKSDMLKSILEESTSTHSSLKISDLKLLIN